MKRLLYKNTASIFLIFYYCSTSIHAQPQQPQELAFSSLDGTLVKAWVFQPAEPVHPDASKSINPNPRRGTVVALHGCGGLYATLGSRKGLINARHQATAEMLMADGYNVVFPDSLTPRGESSLCEQPIGSRKITQRERRADALAALAWVAEQPWADAQRIAVLGWSHGGSAVLAATDANHPLVKKQHLINSLRFKTAIAFYPGCTEALKSHYKPNTALTFLLAADDDWTPPLPCVALADKLSLQHQVQNQQRNLLQPYPIELQMYDNAVHGFDSPIGRVMERKDIPSRLHPGRGVMSGPNPAAREKANARVREILKAAFN